MKKIISIIVIFYIHTAVANIVNFACPLPQDVHGLYAEALAYVRVLTDDSTPLFLMRGDVHDLKSIENFTVAKYHRDYFACEYNAKDHQGNALQITLKNEKAFGLEYCYFPNNNSREQCAGDLNQCYLSCEVLENGLHPMYARRIQAAMK